MLFHDCAFHWAHLSWSFDAYDDYILSIMQFLHFSHYIMRLFCSQIFLLDLHMVVDDLIYMYVLAGRSFQLGFVGLWFLSQL
jgi:hypothetical protein